MRWKGFFHLGFGIVGLIVLTVSPFMAYFSDLGYAHDHTFIYFNGLFKREVENYITEERLVTPTSAKDKWGDNFYFSSPILSGIGMSLIVFGSLIYFFKLKEKLMIIPELILFIGAVLGFAGIMIYIKFGSWIINSYIASFNYRPGFYITVIIFGLIGLFNLVSIYNSLNKLRYQKS